MKYQEVSGQRTVPVLDINGKIIVGFDKKAIDEALIDNIKNSNYLIIGIFFIL